MLTTPVMPGDVILVKILGRSFWTRLGGWAIRFGEWLRRHPSTWNHVIVAHHVDDAGTYWGVQGQPGTVGWVDLTPYFKDAYTISNAKQHKTDTQRKAVCDAMYAMVDVTHYDWTAIGVDGAIVLATQAKIQELWYRRDQWGPGVPGHVVCSSAADYAYEVAGLTSPRPDRWCMPSDWAVFLQANQWS